MTQISADSAVEVVGIGKRYDLGGGRGRGRMMDQAGRIMRRRSAEPRADAVVWALKDVSFKVPRGQVKAVLGRNGSGKTTLMRVLARITAPTTGRAVVRGRVGALFQVGTGFHPELSGRDNIWLSGAILGMAKTKTAALFDEIVDFSEIGDFLDTPVKHYSSGMYTRLAFSVSAYLDADVMLVDEVLSVGDVRFQTKSKDRIRSIVGDGRTVVYVSHSMEAVRQICDSAMVLEEGRVAYDGSTKEAIEYYRQVNKVSRTEVRETTMEPHQG